MRLSLQTPEDVVEWIDACVLEDGFRAWLLTEASADAVDRAKPQDLRVSGDTLRLQLEAVKRWNADSGSSSRP